MEQVKTHDGCGLPDGWNADSHEEVQLDDPKESMRSMFVPNSSQLTEEKDFAQKSGVPAETPRFAGIALTTRQEAE